MIDWTEAYRDHHRTVQAFLKRRLPGQPEEVEDVCQEAFTRAMRAAPASLDSIRVRAYLLRTAANLLCNRVRRPRLVARESDLNASVDLGERIDPGAEDPHAAAERSELRRNLRRLLDTLPPDQRLCFELAVVRRWPYALIAEQQTWSLAKVKVTVHRARKRLIAGMVEIPAATVTAGKDTP